MVGPDSSVLARVISALQDREKMIDALAYSNYLYTKERKALEEFVDFLLQNDYLNADIQHRYKVDPRVYSEFELGTDSQEKMTARMVIFAALIMHITTQIQTTKTLALENTGVAGADDIVALQTWITQSRNAAGAVLKKYLHADAVFPMTEDSPLFQELPQPRLHSDKKFSTGMVIGFGILAVLGVIGLNVATGGIVGMIFMGLAIGGAIVAGASVLVRLVQELVAPAQETAEQVASQAGMKEPTPTAPTPTAAPSLKISTAAPEPAAAPPLKISTAAPEPAAASPLKISITPSAPPLVSDKPEPTHAHSTRMGFFSRKSPEVTTLVMLLLSNSHFLPNDADKVYPRVIESLSAIKDTDSLLFSQLITQLSKLSVEERRLCHDALNRIQQIRSVDPLINSVDTLIAQLNKQLAEELTATPTQASFSHRITRAAHGFIMLLFDLPLFY
jgi:hypothetical protein